MRVRIYPFENKNRTAAAPPSKSMAHRELICAGLAEGVSTISNIAMSEDILATSDCLRAAGAELVPGGDGRSVTVRGTDPFSHAEPLMPCRESGSTLRFMLPICALSEELSIMTGSRRLMQRPLKVYEKIMKEQGLLMERGDSSLRIQGRLRGGSFCVPGDISSQFVSGLLFALPLCGEDSILRLEGKVESRPYIEMTEAALGRHGVSIIREDEGTLVIPGRQRYEPADARIEGDWSNGAYLLALGVRVEGLDPGSLQGDRVCTEYFRRLDEGPAELDIADCPDLGPVLMAYAALRHGCTLSGTARLRIKESDRGAAMQEELGKCGIETVIGEDSIRVGSGISGPKGAFFGHNDHRIVMALTVICARTGGIIEGAEAVRKSFPDYFDTISELGVELEKEN